MALTPGSGGGGSSVKKAPIKGSLPSINIPTIKPVNIAPMPKINIPAPINIANATGGGGAAAAPAPVAEPAPVAAPPTIAPPSPIKDIDWFAQDGQYRAESGGAFNDLTGKLAQILAERDGRYLDLDSQRKDLTQSRDDDLQATGNDFASRGSLNSGLFAQYADKIAAEYAKQNGSLDAIGSQTAQQYGARDGQVNLAGLSQGSDLSSVYGMLGMMGTQAGAGYRSALTNAKQQSAARSTAPLITTETW